MNRLNGKHWSIIIVLLFISVGVALALFVQRTTSDIRDALAEEVLQQQSDVSLLLHEYDALKLAFETERLMPTGNSNSERIESALQTIESRLEIMRFNYSFERLDGAATAHAYVKPILEDVRYWIDEGIPGIENKSDQVLSVSSRRILERYDALRAISTETNEVATELISTQAGYLGRFGKSLMFLLAAFALLSIGVAALLIRQRDLQAQIAVDQQQHAERIKDFADTGADWYWEMSPDLRLNMLSGQSLSLPASKFTESSPLDAGDNLPAIERNIVENHWPVEDLHNYIAFSEYETQWRGQNGAMKTISVSGKPLFNSSGEFTGYRGVGRDTTERKQMELDLERASHELIQAETRGRQQAEQALRDSEMFLRTSLNALPQTLAIVDSGGFVVEANAAWRAYDAENTETVKDGHYRESLSRQLTEAIPTHDVAAKIDWVLDGHAESLRTEVRVNRAGHGAWYAIALSPFESNARRYGVLAIEEVTDRITLEEQDRQQRAELAHFSRLTTVGELATGLAHELNQPLTAISHNCDALMSGISNATAFDEDDLDAISEIHSEAERAGAIIRGLRKLVRKETTEMAHTDINQLVTETMRLSMHDAN